MRGGYFLIDCTGLDLTKGSTDQTISGIYDKVKTAMESNKPIYAVNCNWNSVFVSPIQIFAIVTDTNQITCTAATLQIVVKSTDVITITNMVAE